MDAGIVKEEEFTLESDFCLDRTRTSCLPVARRAVTIDLPSVGDVPPATATRTMLSRRAVGRKVEGRWPRVENLSQGRQQQVMAVIYCCGSCAS